MIDAADIREETQLVQLYEMMNAIREKELSSNDPEFDLTASK